MRQATLLPAHLRLDTPIFVQTRVIFVTRQTITHLIRNIKEQYGIQNWTLCLLGQNNGLHTLVTDIIEHNINDYSKLLGKNLIITHPSLPSCDLQIPAENDRFSTIVRFEFQKTKRTSIEPPPNNLTSNRTSETPGECAECAINVISSGGQNLPKIKMLHTYLCTSAVQQTVFPSASRHKWE